MSFAREIESLLALKAGFGTVLGCSTVSWGCCSDCTRPGACMAQGGAQPPWFACHALSAHRLCSHERVVPGHDCGQQSSHGRAPDCSAAHPKRQISGKALGEELHLIKPAGSASKLMSFEKQLANWNTPRHIEGSPKVSGPH